jgi:hypothetical protein
MCDHETQPFIVCNVICCEQMTLRSLAKNNVLTPSVHRYWSAACGMAFFDYVPLDKGRRSARFIQILRQGSSQHFSSHDIRGTLEVFDLEDAPAYEALSYTWGVPGERINIQLNGQPFSVSQGLHAALRQLSIIHGDSGTPQRRIWIDAICINQEDGEEKSHQVMQMTEIYFRAKQVLLWLGESDSSTALAFDTLRQFAQDDGTTDGSATLRKLHDEHSEREEAICKLSERPYFSRVWVIQEAVVAKVAIVLCGSESMDLTEFSRAFKRITGSGFHPHSLAINVISLGNWRKWYLDEPCPERDDALDLQTLLMYSRDKLCKDDRDKVYALRGIGTQKFAEGLVVDYSETTERVYINCAKHWISIRPDLRVLSTIEPRHCATSSLNLPSWVPDWSQPNHPSGVMQRYFRFLRGQMFSAASRTIPCVSVSGESDILTIKGVCFDTITQVIPARSELGLTVEETLLTPTKFEDFVKTRLSSQIMYTHTGEAFANAALRTVTGDRTGLSSRVADSYRSRYLTSYSDWRLRLDSSIFDLPQGAWKELSGATALILDDKDMFMTKKGYMGIARSGFDVGDLVCIFYGGEVPFIIRQRAQNRNTFKFVTECYVHGIMDGELDVGENCADEGFFQLM